MSYRSSQVKWEKASRPFTIKYPGGGRALTKDDFLPISGSTFYFPLDRGVTRPKRNTENKERTSAIVRGIGRSIRIDTSEPVLTTEEIERWKLDRIICTKNYLFDVDRDPIFLLPPTEKVYSLGPEMDKIDELYRRKGFFTPSEVAHAFFPSVPSFYVELRHVFQNVSSSVLHRIEHAFGPRMLGAAFFGMYPMLFLQRRPTHQKSALKLNHNFWFVPAHPFYKKADKLQQRYNVESRANFGGVVSHGASTDKADLDSVFKSIDLQIFDILARHLDRCEKTNPLRVEDSSDTAPSMYTAVPLIQWMNQLSAKEMAVIQQVPEQHVVVLLTKYVRVFQLLCAHGEDPLVYTDKINVKTVSSSADAEETEASVFEPTLGDDSNRSVSIPLDDPMAAENAVEDSWSTGEESFTVKTEGSESIPTTDEESSMEESGPEPNILRGLDEDLLGLDDILSVHPPTTNGNEKAPSASFPSPSSEGEASLPTRLDILYVRRLPPNIAPRSLSNFDEQSTPLPRITQLAASFLGTPPSLRRTLNNFFARCRILHGRITSDVEREIWRWVPIQTIYGALTKEERQLLRPFKGLTNFLRLHGSLFEVSSDLMHVISHDPAGTVSPFLPHQTIFSYEERVILPKTPLSGGSSSEEVASLVGEHERDLFQRILGNSQIPTTRQQIALLDPENPLLNNDVLYEEVARLLPDHPVAKRQVLARLPPILRAAVPARGMFNNNCSRHIAVFVEKGQTMIQRKALFDEQAHVLQSSAPLMSKEEAVEQMRQSIPQGGVTLRALRKVYLPSDVTHALIQHYGSLMTAIEAFPQYFIIEKKEGLSAGFIVVSLRSV